MVWLSFVTKFAKIYLFVYLFIYLLDGSLYLLEINSIKVQHRVSLADVSHISASLLPDNFFIIHVPADQDRQCVSILLLIIIYYNVIVTIFKMIYYNGRHWKESRVKRERERENKIYPVL